MAAYFILRSNFKNCKSSWRAIRHSCNCNCNWGTCIALPTRRPRAHHRVNPYLGARRQNQTEMFSDHDETSPSIAAVSAPLVALFHARGAATEKVLSPIRRRVHGTTRLPHDEARSVDRPGTLATDVKRSEIYSGVCCDVIKPLRK